MSETKWTCDVCDLNPNFNCSDLTTTLGTLNRIRKTPLCGGGTSATRLLVYINEKIIPKSKIGCKIAIFTISDGRINWGGNPDKIASSLKKIENLEIFAVAFGANKLGWQSLKKLSSGEGHFIPARNAEDVTKAVDKPIEVPTVFILLYKNVYLAVKTSNGALQITAVFVGWLCPNTMPAETLYPTIAGVPLRLGLGW